MNTIVGLTALPSIIEKLLNDRDAIQLQIDACYKPFRDIIQEVMIDPYARGLAPSLYVNDEDIGVSEDFVCFVIRDYLGKYDDQVVGTYKYPIEAFMSADALRKYIADYKISFNIVVDDYCKRKPEPPLHEKLGMDERDLHYRGT